jgi:hypothetical protein
MLTYVLPAVLLVVVLPLDLEAGAESALAHGQKLHNTHCMPCHSSMTGGDGSVLYARERRRVDSLKQLNARVRRCAAGLDLEWSESDFADVVQYLNERYYEFGGQS